MFLSLMPMTQMNATPQSALSGEVVPEHDKAQADNGEAIPALSHQVKQAPSGGGVGAISAVLECVDEGRLLSGVAEEPSSSLPSLAAEEQSLREQLLSNDSLGG